MFSFLNILKSHKVVLMALKVPHYSVIMIMSIRKDFNTNFEFPVDGNTK